MHDLCNYPALQSMHLKLFFKVSLKGLQSFHENYNNYMINTMMMLGFFKSALEQVDIREN